MGMVMATTMHIRMVNSNAMVIQVYSSGVIQIKHVLHNHNNQVWDMAAGKAALIQAALVKLLIQVVRQVRNKAFNACKFT